MDRIQSALENSPRLLAAVDRARQWIKKYRTKQGEEQHHSDKEDRKHHQSFAIQSLRSGFSLEGGNDSYDNEEEYKLRDSFLLDSAASIHVCNNRSRFTTFTPSTGKQTMRAANSFAIIQGYGTVEVHAKSATPGDLKPCTLELLDVAYVPSFQTSLVSFGRAWVKGIRWDTNRMTLDVGNEPLCKVTRKFEQWVLEYNPLSTNSSAAMARASPPRNLSDHKPARKDSTNPKPRKRQPAVTSQARTSLNTLPSSPPCGQLEALLKVPAHDQQFMKASVTQPPQTTPAPGNTTDQPGRVAMSTTIPDRYESEVEQSGQDITDTCEVQAEQALSTSVSTPTPTTPSISSAPGSQSQPDDTTEPLGEMEDEISTPGPVLEPLHTATGKDNLTLALTWEHFLKQRTLSATKSNCLETESHPKPNNDTKQPGGVEGTTTPADQDQGDTSNTLGEGENPLEDTKEGVMDGGKECQQIQQLHPVEQLPASAPASKTPGEPPPPSPETFCDDSTRISNIKPTSQHPREALPTHPQGEDLTTKRHRQYNTLGLAQPSQPSYVQPLCLFILCHTQSREYLVIVRKKSTKKSTKKSPMRDMNMLNWSQTREPDHRTRLRYLYHISNHSDQSPETVRTGGVYTAYTFHMDTALPVPELPTIHNLHLVLYLLLLKLQTLYFFCYISQNTPVLLLTVSIWSTELIALGKVTELLFSLNDGHRRPPSYYSSFTVHSSTELIFFLNDSPDDHRQAFHIHKSPRPKCYSQKTTPEVRSHASPLHSTHTGCYSQKAASEDHRHASTACDRSFFLSCSVTASKDPHSSFSHGNVSFKWRPQKIIILH
jgi:hypothetical protein